MQQIIYDASKIKVFKCVQELCDSFNKKEEWKCIFWTNLLENQEIYTEFVFFLEHQEFLNQYMISGYSIVDIFIWHMDHFNLIMDSSKNDIRCNKIKLALESFDFMLKMNQDKENYIKKLQSDMGNDH